MRRTDLVIMVVTSTDSKTPLNRAVILSAANNLVFFIS
jgi:hypothetical protein